MSAGDLPINLDSVIGFAQWHLSRGDPPGDVMERINADERFSGITRANKEAALNRAARNVAATAAANAADPNAPIGLAIYGTANRALVAGLRVVITMQMPDGHTENMSVVVNVHGNLTRESILRQVAAQINSGAVTFQSGRSYRGEITSIDIGQAIIGSFQNPAITL